MISILQSLLLLLLTIGVLYLLWRLLVSLPIDPILRGVIMLIVIIVIALIFVQEFDILNLSFQLPQRPPPTLRK